MFRRAQLCATDLRLLTYEQLLIHYNEEDTNASTINALKRKSAIVQKTIDSETNREVCNHIRDVINLQSSPRYNHKSKFRDTVTACPLNQAAIYTQFWTTPHPPIRYGTQLSREQTLKNTYAHTIEMPFEPQRSHRSDMVLYVRQSRFPASPSN